MVVTLWCLRSSTGCCSVMTGSCVWTPRVPTRGCVTALWVGLLGSTSCCPTTHRPPRTASGSFRLASPTRSASPSRSPRPRRCGHRTGSLTSCVGCMCSVLRCSSRLVWPPRSWRSWTGWVPNRKGALVGPLASLADMSDLGVTVDPDEEPIVEQYLAVASASVRDAAGCPISQVTSTVWLAGQRDARLPLPGPPVTAVDTVRLDDAEVGGWRLSRPRASLYRAAGWGGEASEVEVTYTHGLPEVPADIIALVCRIAATTLMSYRSDETGG